MADISLSIRTQPNEIIELPLTGIGERFSTLRIINPEADSAVLRSMERYGQITPVVVSKVSSNEYQLLDGFKRLRGARALTMSGLKARIMCLNIRAGKAALMQLNWVGKSINSMEEALVVHSLFHEDSLSQVEIATLLGRHKSWVCRRVALIDRLCDEGRDQIKLGLLPISMGRELVKLPRGNQDALLEAIRKHHLNCHETKKLVDELQARPEREYQAILQRPWEVLEEQDHLDTTASNFFPPLVRTIHRKLIIMERQCLLVSSVVQSTEFGQFEEKEERFLRQCCEQAAQTLDHTGKELQRIVRRDQGASQ
nr:ParB N-terminal domain-containing protein [Desulfobulbaceae bacterium]